MGDERLQAVAAATVDRVASSRLPPLSPLTRARAALTAAASSAPARAACSRAIDRRMSSNKFEGTRSSVADDRGCGDGGGGGRTAAAKNEEHGVKCARARV